MFGRVIRTSAILVAACGFIFLSQSEGFCQGTPPAGGGGVGGGAPTNPTGGIEINANGLLTQRAFVENAGRLNMQRARAAQASLNKDLQKSSKLRKVSLTRLEKEVEKLVAAGQPIPADMRFLAGLTRITHVFYYPETKDIVIAGPAEGYFISANNHVVGMRTGQATLQLQDLIVALRAFSPSGEKTRMISCSIDPTQEGLVRLKGAYAEVQNYAARNQYQNGDGARIVDIFRNALGLQEITINGVPTSTNFARVMVEADYHMKLIGIGLEKPPVKVTSFIEKAKPSSVARNSLQRWFFQPNYDCVSISEDEMSMELVGSGVKLVGEDESVTADGNRKRTGGMNGASRAYCNSFTRMYDKMAERSPLWGELRNLIDMSIAAAFIQEMDLYGEAEWEMSVFGDESKYPVETLESPKHVAPVANAVWKGSYFMTPIAGGVNIQPRVALNSDRVEIDTEGRINTVKDGSRLEGLSDGQWWWD